MPVRGWAGAHALGTPHGVPSGWETAPVVGRGLRGAVDSAVEEERREERTRRRVGNSHVYLESELRWKVHRRQAKLSNEDEEEECEDKAPGKKP